MTDKMNSENKTEKCNKWCKGCEEWTDKLEDWNGDGVELCEGCCEKYDNRTGYCSFDCCISGICDQSC